MSKPVSRWVDKWHRRGRGAREDYKWGVENPSRDPRDAAIEQKETLVAKMAATETWDKWERRLKERGKKKWYDKTPKIGADRYTSGIEAGKPFYEEFAKAFKPHLDAGLEEIRKMPKATLEDAIAKAEAMIRHNAKFTFE